MNEQYYDIIGWRENTYRMTATELYKRVIEDSKSNYNWIAPATELVRICEMSDFPKEYANEIKLAILNCFASLELDKRDDTNCLSTDKDAVWYCYNSLSRTNEKVVKARHDYLTAVIKSIAFDHFELLIHSGPIYKKMCNEWIKSKFDDNIDKEKIDFKLLIEELRQDFDNTIKTAEKEGAFEKEDEERIKRMADYAFKLCDKI